MKFLDDLETIDMSNNHIKFIQGRSFHKVRQELSKLFLVLIMCIWKGNSGIINAGYILFLYFCISYLFTCSTIALFIYLVAVPV